MPERKHTRTKHDSQDYAEFLRTVKLVALALANCSASLDRGPYIEQSARAKSTRHISADYELDEVRKNAFDVAAGFKLAVTNKANTSKPLTIECRFLGHFHCKPEASRELQERFAQSEARLIFWPYFRELVSDLTAKMYIQPILVPLSTEKN